MNDEKELYIRYVPNKQEYESGVISIEAYGDELEKYNVESLYSSYSLKTFVKDKDILFNQLIEILKSDNKLVKVKLKIKNNNLKNFEIDIDSIASAYYDERIKNLEILGWNINIKNNNKIDYNNYHIQRFNKDSSILITIVNLIYFAYIGYIIYLLFTNPNSKFLNESDRSFTLIILSPIMLIIFVKDIFNNNPRKVIYSNNKIIVTRSFFRKSEYDLSNMKKIEFTSHIDEDAVKIAFYNNDDTNFTVETENYDGKKKDIEEVIEKIKTENQNINVIINKDKENN